MNLGTDMKPSVSNLGGTFPRYFVLKFVDYFSKATCIPPSASLKGLEGVLITQAFSCVQEAEKHRCIAGGGVCKQERDGMFLPHSFPGFHY